jgi:iron complex outermembrane receptor protein
MTTLGNVVPNVTIGNEGARDATYIAIRGVSQNERRNVDDATTPFFIDGATVPRMSGVAAYFYDVERLEVLRGPQGTLYGRNSTTGVVNLITKKPNFDGVNGDFEVGYGNYDNVTVKGAVNVPMSDTFAARAAVTYNKRDGYNDNGPNLDGNNDADDFGIRGHLLWNATDNTSLLFTADYYEKKGVGNNTIAVPCPTDITCALGNGLTDDEGNIPLGGQSSRDNSDTDFKFELNHSFESFDIMGLVSHRTHKRNYTTDDGVAAGDTVNGIEIESFVEETTESESISAEVRLTSTTDGPLQWIAGAYMLDEEINGTFFFRPVFVANGGGPPGGPYIWPAGDNLNLRFTDVDLSIKSWAVFGNATYDLTDQLTFRAGVRYTDDEKDKGCNPNDIPAGSFQSVSNFQTGQPAGPPFRAQCANPEWDKVTYNVGLDFAVNDDAMIYGKFSTGYKAGGFNRGSSGPGTAPPIFMLDIYDPEEADAFEIGYKGTFMDGRARLNVAGFYNDYSNKVESVVRNINGVAVNTAINATDVDIWGFEVESSFLYGDSGGRVDFSLGYLDATYGTFDNLPDPILGGTNVIDVSGEQVLNAPDWNFTVNWVPMEWEFGNGVLSPMVQVSYKSSYKTRPHGLLVDIQDDYTKSNLSLHWESNNNGFYGEAYVRNLEDEIVQSASGCSNQGQGGPSVGCGKMFQAPRTFGGRVGYRF